MKTIAAAWRPAWAIFIRIFGASLNALKIKIAKGKKNWVTSVIFYQPEQLTISVEENHSKHHADRVPIVQIFVWRFPNNTHVVQHPS